jgi:hypothetical protein
LTREKQDSKGAGDRMIGWGDGYGVALRARRNRGEDGRFGEPSLPMTAEMHLRVSGLSRREPGSGVQVQDRNFPIPGPAPDHPCLKPEGRDLGPENTSRTRKNMAGANLPLTYFFAAFGFALARFSFRTDGRVARGLTGDLAR